MVHSILEASSTTSSDTACLLYENDLVNNWKQTLRQINVFASHDILKIPYTENTSLDLTKVFILINSNIQISCDKSKYIRTIC